ncbi:MAG: C40 family peptidase [Oscillospiraceae bacterium]
MKYNIILIIAVSIVSIAIIVISVLLSVGGGSGESSEISVQTSSSAPVTTTEPEPEQTTASSTTATESEPDPETVAPEHEEVIEGIITTAKSLIGTEFVDGGSDPDGFDNSGFIYYVLRENGYLSCPRGVTAQAAMGTLLEYDELKRGDLVFFYGEGTTTAGFGGIYCGDGIMIACLMPGTRVKEVDITSNYYRSNFCNGVSLS